MIIIAWPLKRSCTNESLRIRCRSHASAATAASSVPSPAPSYSSHHYPHQQQLMRTTVRKFNPQNFYQPPRRRPRPLRQSIEVLCFASETHRYHRMWMFYRCHQQHYRQQLITIVRNFASPLHLSNHYQSLSPSSPSPAAEYYYPE